jgi:hypothetical protein
MPNESRLFLFFGRIAFRRKESSVENQLLLYDRKSAARMLSINLRGLAYLLSRGEIHFRRIGTKTLIPHAELVRFARGHHPEPVSERKPTSQLR